MSAASEVARNLTEKSAAPLMSNPRSRIARTWLVETS